MMIMDSTSHKIKAILSSAAGTAFPVVVAVDDISSSGTAYASVSGNSSVNNSSVDVIGVPGASTQRLVKFMSFFNADTAANTLTVSYYDGTNTRTIYKANMNPGDLAVYCNGQWQCFDSTGALKAAGNLVCSFSAYQSSSQTLSAGTTTKIQFQTEEWDTGGYFDNATNYRFTPLIAGKYLVVVACGSLTGAQDQKYWLTFIYKNGSSVKGGNAAAFGGASNGRGIAIAVVDMNGSTDYLEGYIQNTFTGSSTTENTSISTFFQAFRIAS